MPTNDNPALDAQLARLVAVCATLGLDPVVVLDKYLDELMSKEQPR